jgi:LAS superfamily LD-carboxypeptidase LdcB
MLVKEVGRVGGTPTHDWLLENAARFGFVPVDDEPWHWEWRAEPA